MFLRDINICQTPLTVPHCTPGVRHVSITEARHKPTGSGDMHVDVLMCTRPLAFVWSGARRGVWWCIAPSPSLSLSFPVIVQHLHPPQTQTHTHTHTTTNTTTRGASLILCKKKKKRQRSPAHEPLRAVEPKCWIQSSTAGCLQWNDA